MRHKQDYKPTAFGAALLLGALAPFMAMGATISYVPANGGDWNVPGNWSLGHCPQANDFVEIIVSGPAHKAVTYDWSGISGFGNVKIDGDGTLYGAIWQFEYALTTTDMQIGGDGEAFHWMEGPPFLWVNDDLFVGNYGDYTGHFYMATSGPGSGLYVGHYCSVGYYAPGDFDHVSGDAEIQTLYVGDHDPGTYWLKDSTSGTTLTVHSNTVIGNGSTGTFEQTGGTFDAAAVMLGLNTGGYGEYLMRGGELDCSHITICFNGNGEFTQSGGTVTTTGAVTIGANGSHTQRAVYTTNEDDGDTILDIGTNLFVGSYTLAKFTNYGGDVTVGGNLEIWDGDAGSAYSYVYLSTGAGTIDVEGEVINHSGYYQQLGGILTTSDYTNNSPLGATLYNSSDFRALNLSNTAGLFEMYDSCHVRGPRVMPGVYFMCNFTNDGTFQMGDAATNGGTFSGHLTNNGTFDYYAGDFSGSTLTNYGTFNNVGPFTCTHLVNHANITATSTRPITATGGGYTNAIENYGNMTIWGGSTVTAGGGKPFLNEGAIYGGGTIADNTTIAGPLVNHNYILPTANTLATGRLRVVGDFTASSSAELRIRLSGTSVVSEYDQLLITGLATLGGKLDVRLIDGFVPNIGDTFSVVKFGARSGTFNQVSLPTLPAGRYWRVVYGAVGVTLEVVDQEFAVGDMNCDGWVNNGDIDAFVFALSYPEQYPDEYPDCDVMLGDINGDGYINNGDIDAFVALLAR